MILLLGATTYIGQAFARALRRRKDSFIPLSRNAFDYTRFEFLFDYVRKVKPDLLINAADCAEKANAIPDEADRAEMLQVNTLLPQTIARVCSITHTTFGHVSSGSIYSGAKILNNGGIRVEENLSGNSTRALVHRKREQVVGFSELDEPNSTFSSSSCSFYSGTKALAEEALRKAELYIWRFHLPFDRQDAPNNFLSQLQDGLKIHETLNSVSCLDDCVAACLELWERRAPLGIYNVVNPGALSTQEVTEMIQHLLKPVRPLQLWVYDDQPSARQRFPRSDCVLDPSKLLRAGVKLRPSRQALEHCLQAWVPQSASAVKNWA